jgi:quinolinate synthase
MPAATTADPVVFLELLGPQRASEKGTTCPGDLPPASDPGLVERARAARRTLGERAFVLGHHYQRDEVIQFADARGDSFRLAQQAAARPEAEFIVFCGVHFMAESADILTADHQQVVLPDLAAGCSMADMATHAQVEEAWEILQEWVPGQVVPLTYMNSSAAIKAITGREGGAICTSSNAARAMAWAFEQRGKVLFLPDQHLGRNTAIAMGLDPAECVVWDPHRDEGGLTPERVERARVVLWRGHCSVHQRFLPEHVDRVRDRIPGVRVLVHPECRREVVAKADEVGSTERIIKVIEQSPAGSKWAVGTELNLVHRLATEHPDKTVAFLDRTVCFCSTMNRIDLPHLTWALEELVAGRVPNRVTVDPGTRADALVALERMLALPAA